MHYLSAAASSAVISWSLVMLISALPISINAFTTANFPVSAAKCKAVAPHLALAFTFALFLNKYLNGHENVNFKILIGK